jgi:hypothetical protein
VMPSGKEGRASIPEGGCEGGAKKGGGSDYTRLQPWLAREWALPSGIDTTGSFLITAAEGAGNELLETRIP